MATEPKAVTVRVSVQLREKMVELNLGKIHPAIRREGRCMANVEFGRLSLEEVGVWADAQNLPDFEKEDNMILSDLYARARTRAQVKATADVKSIGLVR